MAKNAHDTIYDCLKSLERFAEVIIYLNSSTDNTEKISRSFSNVKIFHGEFLGFGKTKNKAASFASKEWILSLDSDEIMNDKLIDEIAIQDFTKPENLYLLKRDNYFLGYKTLSEDYIVRLYNYNYNAFNNNLVHEKIEPKNNNNSIKLKESFIHLNITNINQTLYKTIVYTDLDSKGKKMCFFPMVILKSLFAFIRTYIFKRYFLLGWIGFTIAVVKANRRYYKYLKQFLNCKK